MMKKSTIYMKKIRKKRSKIVLNLDAMFCQDTALRLGARLQF